MPEEAGPQAEPRLLPAEAGPEDHQVPAAAQGERPASPGAPSPPAPPSRTPLSGGRPGPSLSPVVSGHLLPVSARPWLFTRLCGGPVVRCLLSGVRDTEGHRRADPAPQGTCEAACVLLFWGPSRAGPQGLRMGVRSGVRSGRKEEWLRGGEKELQRGRGWVLAQARRCEGSALAQLRDSPDLWLRGLGRGPAVAGKVASWGALGPAARAGPPTGAGRECLSACGVLSPPMTTAQGASHVSRRSVPGAAQGLPLWGRVRASQPLSVEWRGSVSRRAWNLPQEMLKYSKSCEGAEDLQEALSSILGILKAVNDSMHLIAITGYEVRPRPCPAGGAHEPGAGPKATPLPGWALHAHHPERHRQTRPWLGRGRPARGSSALRSPGRFTRWVHLSAEAAPRTLHS